MVDVSKQLELQPVEQSLSVKQQLEQAKHLALIDGDQLLEIPKHKLRDKTDRANWEDSDNRVAGNVAFIYCTISAHIFLLLIM